MHPHAQLITQLYSAFQRKDYAAMAALYHPEAHFSDPAFTLHSVEAIGAMWTYLITAGKDLTVEFSQVQADDLQGSAHWEARYTFSRTGRAVYNRIDARFAFKDGLIYRHEDVFDFWRWSRQALGPIGWLLGWSGWLRNRVSASAMQALARYQERTKN